MAVTTSKHQMGDGWLSESIFATGFGDLVMCDTHVGQLGKMVHVMKLTAAIAKDPSI